VTSLSTIDFLSHLRDLNISVRSRDGQLHVDAPKSSITPELRAQIAQRKPELLALLNGMTETVRPGESDIQPEPRQEALPLSFAQLRLWFLDQLEPHSAAYTISMAARITGALDVAILEKALSEIVRRHEVLRTVFPAINGSPHQEICPTASANLEVVDLSQGPTSELEILTHQRIAAEARKPFDLAKGPLFRTHLLRLGANEHVLVITVHHTVFDGWSMSVLWREFGIIYEAFQSGRTSPLPDLPIQYADFSQWQKRFLEGPVRNSHMDYWRKQLEGSRTILEVPADYSRHNHRVPRGERERTSLDPALSESLRALGQKTGSSLFMILLAVFQVLLYRVTGQNDILIGTPIAGRTRTELERLIGFFVNTIVMRGQLSSELTFTQLLAQVRNTVLDAHAHQYLPFDQIVEAVDAKPDLDRTPLFQVFYNHLNLPSTLARVKGLEIEPFGEFEVESKFDLTLYSCERSNSIDLLLLYNANLFDRRHMSMLLDQYVNLLKQVGENPAGYLDSYSLVSKTSTESLPDPAAPIEVGWEGSITAKFLENVNRNPEQIAVEDTTGLWSYGELERMSSGLAAKLQSLGVKPCDTVIVFAHRSAPLVLALLGILRSGAAFCILNPDYPAARLISQMRRVRPKAWIHIAAAGEPPQDVSIALQKIVGESRITLGPTSKASSNQIAGKLESEIQVQPDSPAYLTFTSGTTGEPKCIVGTHRPVSHFLKWHSHEFGLNASDRFSMLSGLAHDPLLRDIFAPLWVGGTVCIPAGDEILAPGKLAAWFNHRKISVTHLTPGLGGLLAGHGPHTANTEVVRALRYAFFGGDVLLSSDVAKIREVAPHVQCVNFYGTTETPQAMAWHRVEGAELTLEKGAHPIPIGRAIPDVQLIILNRSRGLAGIGEVGEIHVRTPYLSKGYLDDERLTQERFIVNPFTNAKADFFYRTGDLGRYHPDGFVEFVGRSDDQLKIRGYRVEPAEVEAALSDCADVLACAVVSRPDAGGSNHLVAYVAPRDGRVFGPGELRDLLRKSLPDHMVPSAYITIDKLPLTPNGKVDRTALSRLALDQQMPSVAFVAATGDVESQIAQIWSEVLGIEKISVFDNFFDLGGHSLTSTRLIARLRSAFGVEFPLRSIFRDPTIAGFASRIHYDVSAKTYSYTDETPQWNCLVPAQPRGSRTPLFLVAGYHGPNDTLLVLSRIIPHLGSDQPVYGFKPRWIDGGQENYSSINEAAQDFLAELRIVQPKGPYMLGGHCVGGVVALEMARQLKEEGEEVGLLALIDTECPSWIRAFLANARLGFRRGVHMLATISKIVRGENGSRSRAVGKLIQRKMRKEKVRDSEASADTAVIDSYESIVGYRRLAYDHTLKPYPGKITLFINEKQHAIDENLGWKWFASDGLTIKKVPGDHHTMLTDYGKEFGDTLSACLSSAEAMTNRQNGGGADV